MEKIEEIFHDMLVHRAWMLCGNDEDAYEAAKWLDEHDHTVMCVTTDDVEDERMRFVTKLHDFNDTARMLVISYQAWQQIQEHVEVHVLPVQNLTILWKLEDDCASYVKRCLHNAAQRGFIPEYEDVAVVMLPEENVS